MHRSLKLGAASLLAGLLLATPALAAGAPDGQYGCFVWLKGIANKVGALQISGNKYASKAEKGEFSFDAADKVMTFKGPPPLGFKIGQLETSSSGKTVIRLYKETIGNKWGAILCSPSSS